MHYEFVIQQKEDHMSSGDTIDLFGGEQDGYTPGRYTVACVEDTGSVTIVGCGHGTRGMIAVIELGEGDE